MDLLTFDRIVAEVQPFCPPAVPSQHVLSAVFFGALLKCLNSALIPVMHLVDVSYPHWPHTHTHTHTRKGQLAIQPTDVR